MEIKKKTLRISFEKARVEIKKKDICGLKAQVGCVLDISKSMFPLYRDGTMQAVIERMLALAMHFDDDQQIDMFLFGSDAHSLAPVTIEVFADYSQREIRNKYKINGATRYATALELIKNKYTTPKLQAKLQAKLPVFIIFITDGNNSDKKATEALMRELSCHPIFIQFVGIGRENFPFLNKLDELDGRFMDNAGFMRVNDIGMITDQELYADLLNELPQWIKEARHRKLID